MIIELGSLLHGKDYRSEGRTVEKLGLAGLSVKEIHNLIFDPNDDAKPNSTGGKE